MEGQMSGVKMSGGGMSGTAGENVEVPDLILQSYLCDRSQNNEYHSPYRYNSHIHWCSSGFCFRTSIVCFCIILVHVGFTSDRVMCLTCWMYAVDTTLYCNIE